MAPSRDIKGPLGVPYHRFLSEYRNPNISWILGTLGPSIVEPTLQRLTDGCDEGAEAAVVRALGSYLDPRITAFFVERLGNTRSAGGSVRIAICYELARTPRKQVAGALLRAALDKDKNLSRAACSALVALGIPATAQLEEVLAANSMLARCFVFQAIGPTTPKRLASRLIKLGLVDIDDQVRKNAQAAKERIEHGPADTD